MLTIYGNNLSPNSNRVRFVANALKLDYEFKTVNLAAGENKTPEFLKMNPFGKIPVIKDNGFALFESNSIARYLAQRESSNLYPEDLRRRSVVDQWMDFSSIHIGAAVGRVFFNQVLYKLFGGERDERSLKDGLGFLNRFLPIVEQQIGKESHLAGPETTLADISLVATLDVSEVSSIPLDSYPKIKEWRNKLIAQEFYQKVFPSYTKMVQGLMASR